MNRSKNLFLIIDLFTFTTILLAQSRPPQNKPLRLPDDNQDSEMVETLADKLKLNPEQNTKISDLFEEHFKSVRKMMDNDRTQRAQHHQAMDKLKSEFEASVKALLNETQQTEFDQFMEARAAKPQGPPPTKQ